MFFVQTSTPTPSMHQKSYWTWKVQNNQLPTKSLVELKDNSIVYRQKDQSSCMSASAVQRQAKHAKLQPLDRVHFLIEAITWGWRDPTFMLLLVSIGIILFLFWVVIWQDIQEHCVPVERPPAMHICQCGSKTGKAASQPAVARCSDPTSPHP
jgi:hypothetical protein